MRAIANWGLCVFGLTCRALSVTGHSFSCVGLTVTRQRKKRCAVAWEYGPRPIRLQPRREDYGKTQTARTLRTCAGRCGQASNSRPFVQYVKQHTGRLEASLEADLEGLRTLAISGSERKFNEALQTAIVRLVRLTRKLLR
jgi:hypothetical protein